MGLDIDERGIIRIMNGLLLLLAIATLFSIVFVRSVVIVSLGHEASTFDIIVIAVGVMILLVAAYKRAMRNDRRSQAAYSSRKQKERKHSAALKLLSASSHLQDDDFTQGRTDYSSLSFAALHPGPVPRDRYQELDEIVERDADAFDAAGWTVTRYRNPRSSSGLALTATLGEDQIAVAHTNVHDKPKHRELRYTVGQIGRNNAAWTIEQNYTELRSF